MNLIYVNNGRIQLAFLAMTMMFGSLALGQQTDIRPLPTDKTIEREMAAEETHRYKIGLKKGELLQIRVEQKGIDVVLTLFAGDGEKLSRVNAPTGPFQRHEGFCFSSPKDGRYKLEISTFDKNAKSGAYTIKRDPPSWCRHPVQTDVVYGHKDGLALTMDVYRPVSGANGAAILFMASGGWYSRWWPPDWPRDSFHPYLKKGYTVMAVRHGSSPRYSIREAVSDVRRAVRFVRRNAERFGVDPDRLGVTGGSAGGHLSLMLGTTGDDGMPDAGDDLDRISSRVAAVVAWVPPTDLRVAVWEAPKSLAVYKNFPALNISVNEAGKVSPLVHVTKDDAPSLMIMGGKDTVVPAKHGRWINDAFRKNAVPHKLIIIPNAGHNLRQNDKMKATAYRESIAWFDRYLTKNNAR